MYSEDTIAAISTAPGEGGIGIVRMSGSESLPILDRIFKSGRDRDTMDFKTYTMRYGYIISPDDGKPIDEVLVSYMKSPHTYTREDIVEINCHGGMVPVRRILESVLKSGARLAQPGEFTKRAFLNGRIDLSQAEAVIDMIRSKTDDSMNAAMDQLEGKLSQKLRGIRESLLDVMSHIDASIDFPEDDIEDVAYEELLSQCESIVKEIDVLIKSAGTGKILREGLNTVIIGKPNVGKSSLLNALLQENRAIVTDVPGTTRDIIEDYLNIDGIPLNIIDTAGIRETHDEVERIGVERTKKYIDRADMVIFMLDSSEPLEDEDIQIFSLIRDKKTIVLVNKTDLPQKIDMDDVYRLSGSKKIIEVSIKDDTGIDELKEEIYNFVYSGEVKSSSQVLVTNVRHKDLLQKAKTSLQKAIETIDEALPLDFVSIDITDALQYIGEITGETVRDDIIDRIFSQFCVGK